MGPDEIGFTLVDTDLGDWYVIPASKLEEWDETWALAETVPDWAVSVGRPSDITFPSYTF